MEGVLAAFAQFGNDVRFDRTAGLKAALERVSGRRPQVPRCKRVA